MLSLAGWLAITFAAAALGGIASIDAPQFYRDITLPAWAPPGWVFGPVWTVLYLLMGTAAWLIARTRPHKGANAALLLYGVQLLLNALWTWLFFAWRRGDLAFAEILVLWVLVALTALSFWRIRRLAGVMLLPYLLWVSFATALTLSTWRLNPDVLG